MQGFLLRGWRAGNVLIQQLVAGRVATFQCDTTIQVKGQIAHDSIEVADRLRERDEIVGPVAKAQPSVLNNVFGFGAAAYDGCGIVHQSMPVNEVEL